MSATDLKLDWCSHAAARYAVEHWHYSKSLPTPPLVKIGVWESCRFIGCVLFSRGASPQIGKPYGLQQTQICELTRVALAEHKTPTSKIVMVAIRILAKAYKLRLVVSYADPHHSHVGGIYQAMGWIYAGQVSPTPMFYAPDGKLWHSRMCSANGRKRVYGRWRSVWRYDQCDRIMMPGKYKYLYPLDKAMKTQIAPLAQPYPKRPKDSSEPPATHAGEGGAAPTRTLQNLFPLRDRMARLAGK